MGYGSENSIASKMNRLGFHYYDDTDHYDSASLEFWLPKLLAAGTRWIVLYVPERAEIPENFLLRLIRAGIEPIINLQLSLSNPPDKELFRERTAYYRNVGIHLIQFFNRPNLKSSWSYADWQKPNLVERFVSRFCDYAAICISNQIIPIFPLLAPGGDYWDTAFLKEALQILRDKHAQTVLPNIIFSANAGFQEHSLDWGKGGPEANAETHAYQRGMPDHRGFYIFEWYQALIQQILRKPFPIMLFQAGQWSSQTGPFDTAPKESQQQFFKVLNMLQENVRTQHDEDVIPSYVIACNLYKLPTEYVMNQEAERTNQPFKLFAKTPSFKLFSKPSDKPIVSGKTVGAEVGGFLISLILSVLRLLFNEIKPYLTIYAERAVNFLRSFFAYVLRGEKINAYFLIPDSADLLNADQQKMIQKVVKSANCKAGRNLNDALASPKVILINDKSLYPQNIIRLLHNNNCQIRTVTVSKRGN